MSRDEFTGRRSGGAASFSVGILTMPGEHADTLELVDSILAVADPDVRVFVHVNGGPAEPLRDVLSRFDSIHVSACDQNLGVAGGRNHQISSDGFMDSDLALFLDNDLVVSRDLFEVYREAFAALEENHHVGIVGVPYYRYESVVSGTDATLVPAGGPLGTRGVFVDRARVDAQLLARARALGTALRPSNAGAIPDWRRAYLTAEVHVDRLAERLGMLGAEPAPRYNQERPDYLALQATRDYLPASNLPGGSSCMRTATIGEIGMFDELYSPYGAEDVDHAIRTLAAGRENFVILRGCLPHGRHERHRARHTFGGNLLEAVNRARVRRLLCASYAPADPDRLALQIALAAHLAELDAGFPLDATLVAALCGQRIAREQLETGGSPRWQTTVSVDLTATSPGRFGSDAACAIERHPAMTRLRAIDAAIASTSQDVDPTAPAAPFARSLLDELASAADDLLSVESEVLDHSVALLVGSAGAVLGPDQRRQLRLLNRRVARMAIAGADTLGRLARKHPASAAALRRVLGR